MDQLDYWFALGEISLVNPDEYSSLLPAFSSIEELFAASVMHISTRTKLKPKTIESIVRYRDFSLVEKTKKILEKLQPPCRVIPIADPSYPKSLLQIYDAPPLLYCRGTLLEEDRFAIAIVGARKASRYGLSITERIAKELAGDGFTIVSGMAEGIDAAAHLGTLDAGGRTLAILGCGIDVIYPSQNTSLYERALGQGALLSEFPPGTPPIGRNFPRRNRLISGLSLGTVIAEATQKSGSMITARCALDQGKELFALPGHIDSPQSRGPHLLIQQGAKLITSGADIIEEYEFCATERRQRNQMRLFTEEEKNNPAENLSHEESLLLGILDHEPAHFDHLLAQTELPAPLVSRTLSSLTLKGWVESCGGQRYTRALTPRSQAPCRTL